MIGERSTDNTGSEMCRVMAKCGAMSLMVWGPKLLVVMTAKTLFNCWAVHTHCKSGPLHKRRTCSCCVKSYTKKTGRDENKICLKFWREFHGVGRSQWPHGLRRRSAAALLLGLLVRTPPGTWTSVSSECCILAYREVSASGRSLVQRNHTECGVSNKCDREAP
jgi:hypothetical protein